MLDGFTPWPEPFAQRYRDKGLWRGQTLGSLLRERAQHHPERLALVDRNRRWSYRELDERADRLAGGLHARGIAAGDRILIHLPNVAEFLSLSFALYRLGAGCGVRPGVGTGWRVRRAHGRTAGRGDVSDRRRAERRGTWRSSERRCGG